MLININRKSFIQRSIPLPQQGSALPISLFILLVLTIIGATSLNDTVMEEKMSSNFQNGNIAFQAAESSINRTFGDIDIDLVLAAEMAKEAADAAGNPNPDWPTTDPYTMNRYNSNPDVDSPHAHSETTLNSTIRFVHTNEMPTECSLSGANSCIGKIVEIVGNGTISGTTVGRTHIQGVEKIVPGG